MAKRVMQCPMLLSICKLMDILEEVRRIEVQESNIIGQSAVRVVLKPTRSRLIIAPNTPE